MIIIKRTPNADTRTATKPLDKKTLLDNSKNHIEHVSRGLAFFSSMLEDAADAHDWTKIEYIDMFSNDAQQAQGFGKDFKSLPWFNLHVTKERHHVLDHCPDDVTLIDILERVADITMAGLARSGSIYDDKIPDEILQRAYKNTIELLKKNVEVVE